MLKFAAMKADVKNGAIHTDRTSRRIYERRG